MDNKIVDELMKRFLSRLPEEIRSAKIFENKMIIEKFRLLIEATEYAREDCLACRQIEGANNAKSVKQAIQNFGIPFEEINAEIKKYSYKECENFLNEKDHFSSCFFQHELFYAIASILVNKSIPD